MNGRLVVRIRDGIIESIIYLIEYRISGVETSVTLVRSGVLKAVTYGM
jgi:hypothetical protein